LKNLLAILEFDLDSIHPGSAWHFFVSPFAPPVPSRIVQRDGVVEQPNLGNTARSFTERNAPWGDVGTPPSTTSFAGIGSFENKVKHGGPKHLSPERKLGLRLEF